MSFIGEFMIFSFISAFYILDKKKYFLCGQLEHII